jgi:hypothetical protein
MKTQIKNTRGKVLFEIDGSLQGADLKRAVIRYADLSGAGLSDADLSGANLSDADLRGADLRYAKNIPKLTAARLMACPESGAFEGWKKCQGGVIVRLRIPANAKRGSATNRKCRAEFVEVLEVIGAAKGISKQDGKTVYQPGETVRCDSWCDDRWQECAGGIHFFITRAEAEDYN